MVIATYEKGINQASTINHKMVVISCGFLNLDFPGLITYLNSLASWQLGSEQQLQNSAKVANFVCEYFCKS